MALTQFSPSHNSIMPTYSVSLRKMSQCLVSLLQQRPHASARYWTWHSVLQFRVSSIKALMQLQAADPNLITHAAKNMQRTAYTLLSKCGDIQKMRLMNQFSMSLFQLSFLIRNLVSVAWLITEGGAQDWNSVMKQTETDTLVSSNFKWHHGHGLSQSDWKAAEQQGAAAWSHCGRANFNLNANVLTAHTDWTGSYTSVFAYSDFLLLLCNTPESLNAYNGLTNECLYSCLFKEN